MTPNQDSKPEPDAGKAPGPGGAEETAPDIPSFEATQQMSEAEAEELAMICGRYRKEQFLGRGAFGSVWKCRDQVAGIDVAIKQLPPELVKDSAQVDTIRSNFRAIERLHHPNIAAAKTLEVDAETGECFLVLEYVKGIELNRLLSMRGDRMALDEVIEIAGQVAAALDFCHGHNIIHRDIKPSNIIVQSQGEVKILDFGLAAEFETTLAGGRLGGGSESVVTGGTLGFMPPEQWKGQRMDGRTDQYGLAATMYKLLSGRAPFEGAPTMDALMAAVENQPVPPIEGLDPKVWRVIEKALSKERKQRFDTCGDFIDACRAAVAPRPSRWRQWSPFIAFGVAGAVLASVGLHIALGPRSAGESAANASPGLRPERPLGLRYQGLVIGINEYADDRGWPDLANARNDAEDVAEVLRDRYGFRRVEMLVDEEATRGAILQKIEDMALALDVNDAMFVFFAGHGEYSPALDEGYWIPADGTHEAHDPQAKAGWIKNLEVTSLLAASDARHMLVVADSCYAGALARRNAAVVSGVQTNAAAYYSRLLNRRSRYVIASGEYWEEAYDSGFSNGPFTRYLLDALKTNTNRWMSAFELADTIRSPYHEHTGNTMRVGPLLRHGAGQFVFELSGGDPDQALDLAADPAPVVSENPLTEYATLTRSGRTNAAENLLRKLPADVQTNALLQSVATYYDPEEQQARKKRLDEMMDYLQRNPPELDPQLQQALHDFARPRILVVLGPDDPSGSQRGTIDETIWRSGLTEGLRSAGGLRVFDRQNLEDVLFEVKLSTTRVSDDRARSMVGKVLPASLLVTGEYFSDGTASRVFLRLLAAESAEVLGAFEVTVDDPDNLADEIEAVAARIHTRALVKRPLQAKVLRAEGDTLQAGVGWFHGAEATSRFELLRRVRQEHVLFEEYREQRVGTAGVAYLGENTIDLAPEWTEPVPADEYDSIWVRELVDSAGG